MEDFDSAEAEKSSWIQHKKLMFSSLEGGRVG
jgi:hypothetical protein